MISATKAIRNISNFAKLERILAFVCITTPIWLILGDNGSVRGSISAYYNMEKSVLFYVPLSVAFMLFLVNGVIKEKHWYNTALGVALAGLVLFNHIDYEVIHFLCAFVFFLGNAAVIVIFTPKDERWFKISLVAIIVAALAVWGLKIISLFWAEWISLAIIGLHYILESWGVIE